MLLMQYLKFNKTVNVAKNNKYPFIFKKTLVLNIHNIKTFNQVDFLDCYKL